MIEVERIVRIEAGDKLVFGLVTALRMAEMAIDRPKMLSASKML